MLTSPVLALALVFLGCTTPDPPHPEAPEALPPPMAAPPPVPAPDRDPVGLVSEAPKSILLISWDTVRLDRVGTWGGRAETPHLTALAARGARFDAAITHVPETALSHWSVMTGVEPEVHGDVPGTGGSRYRGPTIAEIAKAHGLATGAFIGGVTLAADASGLQRGFDVYDDRYNWESTHLKRPGRDVTERAADWMKRQTGPTFTFVHLFDAHTPYRPPPPYDTLYPPHPGTPAADHTPGPEDLAAQLALYDGEIAHLDTLLPPLIEAAGTDTVIALFSDHGESFEHGYLFNHRDSLWDSTARVPLVVVGPGVASQVIGRQVALTDLVPTVLSLAGLPGDAKAQGQHLFQEANRTTVHAVSRPFTDRAAFAARTLRAKGIWQSDGTVLGYDLAQDSAETRDLGAIPESLEPERARYRKQILESAAIQREPLPPRALPPDATERLNALGYGGD